MTPILESGDFRGEIARCDTCGRTSGWLDSEDAYTWTEERREARPVDGFGEWLIVWDTPASKPYSDAPDKAKVACPDHHAEIV